MNELIKITETNGQKAVSARELYDFLGIKRDFTTWCKKMFEYGFEENKDFTPFWGESTGGRPSLDYALTLDCSKEISMLQRSEKGKQARQYFIDCEKKLVEVAKPLTQIEILIQSAQLIQAQEQRLGLVENKIQELDARTLTSPDYFTIAGYASLQGTSINLQMAAQYGRKAMKMCEAENLTTGVIPDPRFGKVRTYPTFILKRVFEQSIN
jgi:phage anti-repressor protein